MPKVSVIIPVYNVEQYLCECLDSVVNQTLKDIEIICVDDGSTDNSGKILDEYAAKDSRVKVLRQQNLGAGAARNAGMKIATGKYLSILDSDDIFAPDMLQVLYQQAEKTQADITICRCQRLDMSQQQIVPTPWTLRYLPEKEVFNYHDITPYVFEFTIGWSWDKLYRLDFVQKHQLRFQQLRSTNDAYFVFISLCVADKITTADQVLITHRQNTGSQLSETRDKDPFCFITACQAIRERLIQLNLYQELEASYLNWIIDFCSWQISTISPKNRTKVKHYLENNFFKKIHIYQKPKSFFRNQKAYYRLHHLDQHQWKWLKLIFSITNAPDQKHKTITILGMHIHVKRRGNH